MEVQWPEAFQRTLNRYAAAAAQGRKRETDIYVLILAAVDELRDLNGEPEEESFTFKTVRQCRKRTLWRVSHPFREGLAVRVIAWFPRKKEEQSLLLFSPARRPTLAIFSTALWKVAPRSPYRRGIEKRRQKTMEAMNFRRGNEQIDAALKNSDIAAKVAAVRAGNKENDRAYKMRLAMIRDAANLTQVELAENMKSTQGVVSKVERSDNMLLQTLLRYLDAAGADDVRIVVSMRGQDIEVDLGSVREDTQKDSKLEAV